MAEFIGTIIGLPIGGFLLWFLATTITESIKDKKTGYKVGAVLVVFSFVTIAVESIGNGEFIKVPVSILTAIFFIFYAKNEYNNENIRIRETGLLPERIEKYISEYGYTSAKQFVEYCKTESIFIISRSVKFENPDYKRIQELNKNRKPENKIKADLMVDFPTFAVYHYKTAVVTRYMQDLMSFLSGRYMFDMEQVYEFLPEFRDFFTNDSGEHDTSYNYFAAIQVIRKMISQGKIKIIKGDSKNIYQSTVIPEENSNMIQGETMYI